MCYQQLGNPARMIWFLTPYWYVGKRDEKALGQGWVQVRSLAPVPELISGVWSVWNSAERKWVEAPDLRIAPDDTADDEGAPLGADGRSSAAGHSTVPKALPIDPSCKEEGGGIYGLGGSSVGGTATAAASAAAAIASTSHGGPSQIFLLHDSGHDVHARLTHDRVLRINDYLRNSGCATWFEAERVPGNFLDTTCAAIDDSDIVLVFVTGRSLDRVAGKNGASDSLKKEFEYAERTKGAERLIPVVLEPSVRSSRDWWGSIGMVLGSRPFTDLAAEVGEASWEAGLHSLLDEITLLRGGTSASAGTAGAACSALSSAAASTLGTASGSSSSTLPVAASASVPPTHPQPAHATSGISNTTEPPPSSLASSSSPTVPPASSTHPSSALSSSGLATSAASAPPPPPAPLGRGDSSTSELPSAGPSKAPPAAAATPPGERTMAQKVARVREELSLDPSLPIAKAVAEANAVMGLEGHGSLAKQVEALLTELGVL